MISLITGGGGEWEALPINFLLKSKIKNKVFKLYFYVVPMKSLFADTSRAEYTIFSMENTIFF